MSKTGAVNSEHVRRWFRHTPKPEPRQERDHRFMARVNAEQERIEREGFTRQVPCSVCGEPADIDPYAYAVGIVCSEMAIANGWPPLRMAEVGFTCSAVCHERKQSRDARARWEASRYGR